MPWYHACVSLLQRQVSNYCILVGSAARRIRDTRRRFAVWSRILDAIYTSFCESLKTTKIGVRTLAEGR